MLQFYGKEREEINQQNQDPELTSKMIQYKPKLRFHAHISKYIRASYNLLQYKTNSQKTVRDLSSKKLVQLYKKPSLQLDSVTMWFPSNTIW